MSTLNLRVGNDALTFQELDDNFTNLNNDKYEINDSPQFTAVGIGTAASSIALDISATNAIKLPVGTDAQRPTAATGMIRYNSTSSSFEGYSGTAWASLGGVKDVDGDTTILAESSAGADEDVLTFITGGANSAVLSSTQFDVEVNLDVTGTITASSTIGASNLSGTNTGDEPAASATVAGIVELATVTEVNTGTDTVRAVTPAGVAGFTGSANVVTLGTITTGTWQATAIADAYISSAATWNAKQDALTFGITDGNAVDIDGATNAPVSGDIARFTANGIEGADASQVKTDLSLNNVENTALSSWPGTTNITTLGTITTGTWNGGVIAEAYLQNQSGTNTGDEPDASATVKGIVELATVTEVNTGTDTVRAVTPAGVAGFTGSANVVTVGTISTGTWQGTAIADAYISSAATWNAKQSALTFGIADTNSVVINSVSVADNDYAKFTASGLEGRSTTEVKSDLAITSGDISDVDAFSQSGTYASLRAQATTKGDVGLGNVENTALSTWAGSTNITTLGTIATGTWNGSVIASAYLDSDTAHLSGAQTFSGAKSFSSGISFGNQVAGSTTDLSKHIALYSTNYGFSITNANINLVSAGVNTLSSTNTALTSKVNHNFSAGIDVTGQVDGDTFQEALTTSTGGSYAVNCTTAGVHWRTLNAACTVSFTNTPASNTSKSVTLIFQQDATGGRVITWPTTNWYWAENIEPPQSTGANDIDVYNVQIINNGGTLYYYASLGVKNAS